MAIKLLKQNLEYFKNTNNIIKSSQIDDRFNDIVNYLNDEIIFNLNNINDNIIAGSTVQEDINSILKSKSDVGYLWKKINNDDFSNNVIDIKKLNYKLISNSIFRASYNGDVQLVQNQNMLNNTIVCNNQGVKFDRIDSNYIDSLTKITGDKIKYNSITTDNLRNIIPTISNNSIIGTNFKQRVITTKKIIDDSISINSFTVSLQTLLNNYIWSNIIPKNFIKLDNIGNVNNIKNNWDRNFLSKMLAYTLPLSHNSNYKVTIPIEKFDKFRVKNIIQYYTHFSKETDLSLTDPNGKKMGAEKIYILSPNNFKSNSINPNRLVCWFHRQNNEKCLNINNIIANDTLSIDHFTSTIKTKIG